jgi:four helix bundle protein
MAGKNYQDLTAWQEAMNLVESIYKITKQFPKEEQYCLVTQIRRAAISVPSNIAEGQGRRAKKEFSYFLKIAHGSVREIETQLFIAKRLQYIDETVTRDVIEQAARVGRLVTGLINSLDDAAD